ncbi:hypothetical protein JRF84_13855 [Methylobacterium organophilum]|uniref:hypothetical protein n=1 Tax=Methylobacterium organophilum TaxID=410 RepID=UPI0019CF940C|nr:hypothetical protein [Methylobacterium organophilum]MBN6820663.1 hypothetical protein [Methylobacterium organophilum]
MDGQPDPHRSQILRQQCNRILRDKSIHDIVGALEMLTADALLSLPGIGEAQALSAFDAIAGDIRNIIRERFATQGKGH